MSQHGYLQGVAQQFFGVVVPQFGGAHFDAAVSITAADSVALFIGWYINAPTERLPRVREHGNQHIHVRARRTMHPT